MTCHDERWLPVGRRNTGNELEFKIENLDTGVY